MKKGEQDVNIAFDENKEQIIWEKPTFSSSKKEKETRWITRAMADEFTREDVLFTTVREALLYLAFMFAITMCTIGRRDESVFYLTEAIKAQFIDKEFETVDEVGISFMDIKTSADFWFYMEDLLLDSLYWEHYYSADDVTKPAPKDDRKVLYQNLLLGVPRIRQVKVRSDSCETQKYLKKVSRSCYDMYSWSAGDRKPFGLRKGTPWTYTSAEKLENNPYRGKISTYEGGGFYVDLSMHKKESAKILEDLRKNLWITRGTRIVLVDFSLYNANLNLFIICKLVFEFPPTGGVLPNYHLVTLKLMKFFTRWDYVTFGFECVVYVFAIFFVIEEIREILYFKFRYFLQFWTYVDLVIISLALGNLVTSFIVFPNAEPTIQKIMENPTKHGNLELLGSAKLLYNDFAASLLFLAYIKVFKYLNFNKTMGQLNNTLKNCALDILGFSIMFFIIFFAFAELGYLVFGSQVEDFSNFGISMFTLLRTILGDFEYYEIEKANKVLAPIFFMSFIFFVFFVLFNMFLAIINDTYSDVKTEVVIAPDELSMSEYLKKSFYRMLQRCGCKVKYKPQKVAMNETIQQIRDALKKCGFNDLEIEMFFARYGIDPNAVMSDYDMEKIVEMLEKQLTDDSKDKDYNPFVQVGDFITQQERLNQIEMTIQMLGTKVDNLLKKLQAFENMRKTKPG